MASLACDNVGNSHVKDHLVVWPHFFFLVIFIISDCEIFINTSEYLSLSIFFFGCTGLIVRQLD